ncbi:transglutaminase domain-containing protein [Corynebacterium hansenii]|uniref:Transglutaminase domain-containing protein n=1 Tax=Corynebacterium hansenii TaxID=394964 RepID=A0ABV7ZSL8_9CORY|nr:transglutaminase family protein [Corynebacterium hansenii]WJY99910.1 Transglutaminase-like superfamily protein [Corynebacterium hansenii]
MLPDESFLASSAIIDADHPRVAALAEELRAETPDATIAATFAHVRDRIAHASDVDGGARHPVATTIEANTPVTASETLEAGAGYCYAQAHLLAALLRANGIPAGLRYQEVDDGVGGTVLHGIVAAWAPYLSETGGWLLLDPRHPAGDPRNSGHEWQTRALQHPFERNLPEIHAEPSPAVVTALREGGRFPAQP